MTTEQILTAVIAIAALPIVNGALRRLYPAHRLAARLEQRSAIYSQLPEGTAKETLGENLNKLTLEMLGHINNKMSGQEIALLMLNIVLIIATIGGYIYVAATGSFGDLDAGTQIMLIVSGAAIGVYAIYFALFGLKDPEIKIKVPKGSTTNISGGGTSTSLPPATNGTPSNTPTSDTYASPVAPDSDSPTEQEPATPHSTLL